MPDELNQEVSKGCHENDKSPPRAGFCQGRFDGCLDDVAMILGRCVSHPRQEGRA